MMLLRIILESYSNSEVLHHPISFLDQNKEIFANFRDFFFVINYGFICPTNGSARKKCVAFSLTKEWFSTLNTAKKLNSHHSTDVRVIELKCETGDIDRKSGSSRIKTTTTIAED